MIRIRPRTALFATALALALCAPPAEAQTPLTTVRIANGFSSPLYVTSEPDNADRLFVVQQRGLIRVIENGVLQATPFLNLTIDVSQNGNERGLLGLAFHPDYANNGFFYVSYTRFSGHASVIERFSVSANPNVADASSGTIIFGPVAQPFSNHNGGNIQFGLDGKLYLGLGDGGSGGDPGCRSQNPLNILGKIVRLNDDGTIPSDNPFVGQAGILGQIWALGVRNPWRFSFDRLTGDFWMGDVGQGPSDPREELDFQSLSTPGGVNYGWKVMEGTKCFSTSSCAAGTPACNSPALTLPFLEYGHGGGNCSVTGGYVYRGCEIPDLNGTYFYADYCSARIWSLRYDGVTVTEFTDRTAELDPAGAQSINSINSFGEDADGELYIVDQQGGEIFKIIPNAPQVPLVADTSTSSVSAGGTQNLTLATFDCERIGDAYVVLGTLSGTAPGFALDGTPIPINIPDPWFNFALATINQPPFAGTFGFLDEAASGSASITFGAGGNPNFVGLTVSSAFVVLDLSNFNQIVFASNPVGLTFVP